MAFIELPDFIGKVYVPDDNLSEKKHNCKDCFSCQMCSDERCDACLKSHCSKNLCEEKDEKQDDRSFDES